MSFAFCQDRGLILQFRGDEHRPKAASFYKRRGEVLFLVLYSVGRGDSFTSAGVERCGLVAVMCILVAVYC